MKTMFTTRRGAIVAALLSSLLPLAGALGMASVARAEDPAAAVEVKIDNFTFGPPKLTVKAGTTVTWINEDDIPHTVVSAGKFRSKTLDTEDKFSFTFTTPGTYVYFCSLHPHMTGTVVVEGATGSNSDAPPQAPSDTSVAATNTTQEMHAHHQ
jgi:amicyanin